LKKALIERALGAELTEHLGYESAQSISRVRCFHFLRVRRCIYRQRASAQDRGESLYAQPIHSPPPERTDNKYLDHRVTCNEQPLARARQISAPDLGQQVAAVFGVFDGQSVGFFIVEFV
jgi:hypothetical protein